MHMRAFIRRRRFDPYPRVIALIFIIFFSSACAESGERVATRAPGPFAARKKGHFTRYHSLPWWISLRGGTTRRRYMQCGDQLCCFGFPIWFSTIVEWDRVYLADNSQPHVKKWSSRLNDYFSAAFSVASQSSEVITSCERKILDRVRILQIKSSIGEIITIFLQIQTINNR